MQQVDGPAANRVVVTVRDTPGPVHLRAGEKLRSDLGSRTDLLISSPPTTMKAFEI